MGIMKNIDKTDNIIKKMLNVTEIDKSKRIEDPFILAAIGIEIEEDLDIHLSSEEFMKCTAIGDVKRMVKKWQ